MPRRSLLLPLMLLLVGFAACHRVPVAGVWKLEMMTNPKPPLAGQSTLFRVLLMDGGGAPIDGGAAVINLALPSRSGPPLRITLAPVGHGIYSGRAALPAAGTWTATLTMARQGRIEIQRYPVLVRPAA